MTDFPEVVHSGSPLLTDGGIETRLLYEHHLSLPEHVEAAGLVGHPALTGVYTGYLDAAASAGLPVVIGTPTFRAGVGQAEAAGRDVVELNRAAVAHHRHLRARRGGGPVFVAGVLGPSGDAYTPGEALGRQEAESYHAVQAEALAEAGADLLFAATFPSVEEAIGVARAMGRTGLPYVVSYVLGPDGRVLDGTLLAEAVRLVDAATGPRPLLHSLSCVHPRTAALALSAGDLDDRVLECKANASALNPDELVSLDHLDSGDPGQYAAAMWGLHRDYGLRLLGGCCGTDERHIRALASLVSTGPTRPGGAAHT